MTKLREFYHCEICGNIVEIVHEGASSLVCCGKPMIKLEAKTEDQGQEKHVPIIEETDSGFTVRVGSVEHPMEDEHYIEFIEVLAKGKVLRKELKPGQAPEAEFCESKSDIIEVREHCSVHGLWKNK
ncbi:MAG: desulfoferrodoxin [Actinomycetia bacterium]|nr:desulfoferrodoxin [Actinomycetes bacterium]